jgi:hypothetical protein
MVTRMARPEQVLITTDENGNATRVQYENTESTNLFDIMKELMIYLALLNWDNTRYTFEERLEKIVRI